MIAEKSPVVGRFAPSPSGRMHLGNIYAALIAWLSVRSQGGTLVLRMEDLDTQRCNEENARLLRQDLQWLGLDWDAETPPQSQRTDIYQQFFEKLLSQDLLYPCYCTREQLHSVNAPHLSDGTYVYPGTCRSLTAPPEKACRTPSWRVKVPDCTYVVDDLLQDRYMQNLQTDCGDFIVKRSDGLFVYQLACTVDDGLSGVTEVVRGADLLSSTPRQMFLQKVLGLPRPIYGHVSMLISPDGRRLSKRDKDLHLGCLRQKISPEKLLGILAGTSGITPSQAPVSAKDLISEFSWKKLKKEPIRLNPAIFDTP